MPDKKLQTLDDIPQLRGVGEALEDRLFVLTILLVTVGSAACTSCLQTHDPRPFEGLSQNVGGRFLCIVQPKSMGFGAQEVRRESLGLEARSGITSTIRVAPRAGQGQNLASER